MSHLYRSAAGQERVQSWCVERLDSWTVPHQTERINTMLGVTHVVRVGSGPDTVVFLPGTNFNAATNLELLSRLARRCQVLAVDLPGQPGLSTSRRTSDNPRIYRRWLTEVLDALHTTTATSASGSVTLLGHSRGAYVALCADPADVGGLVLVNPAGLTKVGMSRAVMRTAIPWLLRPTEARSRALLQLMSGSRLPGDTELVTWLTLVAKETRSGGAPGPAPRWCTDAWRSTAVRVLSGQEDCFFPPQRLAGAVRDRLGIETAILSGIGHLSVQQEPSLVADCAHELLSPTTRSSRRT